MKTNSLSVDIESAGSLKFTRSLVSRGSFSFS